MVDHDAGRPADPLASVAARAAEGDQKALAELHARFQGPLRGFFQKRGVRVETDIDDLVQLTWMEVWKCLSSGRYDPARAAVSTFLYAVAMNVWMRHRRSAGRQRPELAGGDDGLEVALPGLADPATIVPSAELLEAVRGVMRRCEGLSSEEREIVTASAAGSSDRELAAKLGLAPSTVNAKKQSGLEKVRRALARLGFRAESGERDGEAGE